MRFMVITVGMLALASSLYLVKPLFTIVTGGQNLFPVLVETINMLAHWTSTFPLFSIIIEWLRNIKIFVDVQFSIPLFRNLGFIDTREFRIGSIIGSIFLTIGIITTSLFSALSTDYYFTALRIQSGMFFFFSITSNFNKSSTIIISFYCHILRFRWHYINFMW